MSLVCNHRGVRIGILLDSHHYIPMLHRIYNTCDPDTADLGCESSHIGLLCIFHVGSSYILLAKVIADSSSDSDSVARVISPRLYGLVFAQVSILILLLVDFGFVSCRQISFVVCSFLLCSN